MTLVCIVEGHGDVRAVPLLVRRVAAEIEPARFVSILPPLRVPRSKLVKPGELERSVDLAARKSAGRGGILILVDSEQDCPAQLAPEILRRACLCRSDVPISVVLAKCEYEAWFLAAADSLRGKRGLANDLSAPPQPESIRDAKGWLSSHMAGKKYREVLDQPALTASFDLVAGRKADSFAKCCREIAKLLREIQSRSQANEQSPTD